MDGKHQGEEEIMGGQKGTDSGRPVGGTLTCWEAKCEEQEQKANTPHHQSSNSSNRPQEHPTSRPPPSPLLL